MERMGTQRHPHLELRRPVHRGIGASDLCEFRIRRSPQSRLIMAHRLPFNNGSTLV